MKRTWVLWIGLTVLSASVCAGMEEYAEPVPNEGNPDEVTYTTADSKPDGGYEVTDPAPAGNYEVGDPGSDGGSEVTDPKPEEGGGVIGADSGDRILTVTTYYSGPVIGPEGEIVTLVAGNGCETTDSLADTGLQMLAAIPDADYVFTLALAPTATELAANMGMSWVALDAMPMPNDLGTSPTNTCLNWDMVPELTQIRSGVGLDMAAQMTPHTHAPYNLPDVTGQPENVTTPISLGVRDALGAMPIPEIASLLASQ